MGRSSRALRALVALTLFAAASPALSGEGEKGKPAPGNPAGTPGRTGYTLGEVKILGSAEHPGVLFFLPRAPFRLHPLRAETDWKKRILLDDKSLAGE